MSLIQFRRGPSSGIPGSFLLAAGEPGFETDTFKLKIGDGTKQWSSLPYIGDSGVTSWANISGKPPIISGISNISLSGGQIIYATGENLFAGVSFSGTSGLQIAYSTGDNALIVSITGINFLSDPNSSGIVVIGSGSTEIISDTVIIGSGRNAPEIKISGGYTNIRNINISGINNINGTTTINGTNTINGSTSINGTQATINAPLYINNKLVAYNSGSFFKPAISIFSNGEPGPQCTGLNPNDGSPAIHFNLADPLTDPNNITNKFSIRNLNGIFQLVSYGTGLAEYGFPFPQDCIANEEFITFQVDSTNGGVTMASGLVEVSPYGNISALNVTAYDTITAATGLFDYINFSGSNAVTGVLAGDGISVTNNSGNFTISNTGVISIDSGSGINILGSGGYYIINSNFIDLSGTNYITVSNSSGIYTIETTGLQPSGNYSVIGHTHSSSDITDFNSSISGLLPSVTGSGYVNSSFANNKYTISVNGLQPSGNYSTVGHTHTSSNITDFNSSVSGLLPLITGNNYLSTSFLNNTYTLSVTGLQPSGNYSVVGHTHTSSEISDFNNSVSGLLPVKNIIGSGYVSVNNSSGTYTISVTGLQPSGNYSLQGHTHTSNEITDFNNSVSGLLPSITGGSNISISNSNNTYTISTSGLQTSLTNPITGTGTTNYLSKFNNSSGITNSIIYDNNTKIGIGTSSPQQLVHISGNIGCSDKILRLQSNNQYLDFTIGTSGCYLDYSIFSRNGTNCFGTTEANRFYTFNDIQIPETKQIRGNNGNAFIVLEESANTTMGIGAVTDIRFYSSYSEKMRLDSNGRLGIGTTSPSYPLHVANSGYLASGLVLGSSTTTGIITGLSNTGTIPAISFNSVSPNPIGQADIVFEFRKNGNRTHYIDGGGNLVADGTYGNFYAASSSPAAGNGTYIGNGMRRYNPANGFDFAWGESVTSTTEPGFDLFPIGGTHISSGILLRLSKNSTKSDVALQVNGNGRVGIGITSPSYQLHVVGTGNFSQALLVNGTSVSLNGHTHTPSQISSFISNYSDNRVLTSTGSINDINAESNLTFDGTNLVVNSGTAQRIVHDTAVSFTKADYAGTGVYDPIISGVLHIARDDYAGAIFNVISETYYDNSYYTSPSGTEWNSDGWSNLQNYKTRTYTNFYNALNNQIGNYVVGSELIMKHTATQRYWKIKFNSWTQGGNGGGFAYTRQELLSSDFLDKTNSLYSNGTLLIGSGNTLIPKNLTAGSNISISNGSGSITISVSGLQKSLASFSALNNQPPASGFATLDTRNSIAVLDFDDSTVESGVFIGVIPDSAALGSGVNVRINWTATTATSGTCRWGAQFERMNTDIDADSFDSTISEASSTTNTTCGIPTVTTIACTGIDSLAAGDFFRLKIYRAATDAVNDTMIGDAELIAIEVRSVI